MTTNPFLAAARSGKNAFWRYVVTVLFSLAALLVGTVILTIAVFYYANPEITPLSDTAQTALMLVPFGFLILGLWIGLVAMNHRPFSSLIRPEGRFRWGSFFLSGGLWLALSAASDLVLGRIQPAAYHFGYNPRTFWPYVLVVVVLLPIQVLAEESYFRGYLTQGFGLAGGFWAAWLVPSLLFGLLHGYNPEASAYGLLFTLPIYIGIGLLLGWITLRTGGLEMSLGLHLANNLYGAIFVTSTVSAFSGPTLFKMEYNPPVGLVVFLIAALLYLFLILRSGRRFFLPGGWAGLSILVLLLPLFLSACAPIPAARSATPTQPAIVLKDCRLKGQAQVQVKARCGKLAVAEDPAQPSGRKIELNVAVVKAVSRTPAPDPIFLLAGGPGQAATEAFVVEMLSIERLRFKRDLVLVDQRGTGQSHPLNCPDTSEPVRVYGADVPLAKQLDGIRKCRAGLDADPRLYTTEYAMRDLEQVRQALGYEKINLLGVSYGTRAALAYLSMYPAHTRSLILDGIVPPGWLLGEDLAPDAQRALGLIFQRCAADKACRAAFPNLESEFNTLRQKLGNQPAVVTVTHPTSGKPARVEMNPRSLGSAVRLMSYSDKLAALLPLGIHSAVSGDYQLLASEYLLASDGLDAGISEGMYNSVVCAEDTPYLPAQLTAGDSFFDPQLDRMRAACDVWMPAPARPEQETLNAGVPAFLISGDADPVTPPENGEQVAKLLPDSLNLVLPGLGHNNFYVGCVPDLLYQFLDAASPKGIDTGCIKNIHPQPFFLTPAGPVP